jgi:hypothetical protein
MQALPQAGSTRVRLHGNLVPPQQFPTPGVQSFSSPSFSAGVAKLLMISDMRPFHIVICHHLKQVFRFFASQD